MKFTKSLIPMLLTVLIMGCVTTPQSIENKAYVVTSVVSSTVLKKHPEWKPQFIIARDDLLTLAATDTIGINQVLDIINRLPLDQMKDGSISLYVQGAVLFFSDELSTISVKEPIQLKSAVAGMVKALNKTLGQ